MAEFKEKEKHTLSEDNTGPITFKYCWRPSGITKREIETVIIKQELQQSEDSVFYLKNDEQTWNDNVTIDEIDIKTELFDKFDSEQSGSSDSGFTLLAKQLKRLVDNQYDVDSADDCNNDSPVTAKTINAEETGVYKLENALKINKNKKKNQLIKEDQGSVVNNKHVQPHKEAICQVFACDHCHFVTLFKNSLRRHILSLHFPNLPTPELLQCDHCNFSTKKKCSMARHMLKHLKTFPFSCDSCTYKSITNYQLNIHKKSRHVHEKNPQRKTKVCEICGKVISGLNNFPAHLLTHKKGPHFFCKLCPFSGRCRKRYRMHVLTHSEDYKYKTPVRRHACPKCDYTSDQLRHVRRHAIVHVRKANGVKKRKRRRISKKKEVQGISFQSVS